MLLSIKIRATLEPVYISFIGLGNFNMLLHSGTYCSGRDLGFIWSQSFFSFTSFSHSLSLNLALRMSLCSLGKGYAKRTLKSIHQASSVAAATQFRDDCRSLSQHRHQRVHPPLFLPLMPTQTLNRWSSFAQCQMAQPFGWSDDQKTPVWQILLPLCQTDNSQAS